MPDTVTWPAIGAVLTVLLGMASLAVNIRGQLQKAAEKSDERARRIYEKIDRMEEKMDVKFARKEVVDLQIKGVQATAEEAQRMAQLVSDRLNCPVRAQ